jgi:hypothetical protein
MPADTVPPPLPIVGAETMLQRFTQLNEPVIDELLRRGETLNLISHSKARKSWMVGDLAIAKATGRPWLGRFPLKPGRVLLIDNELHPATLSRRLATIAQARGVLASEFRDSLDVAPLRGQLVDIHGLRERLRATVPGRYDLLILDALYRFYPRDCDENSNSDVAGVFNVVDAIAAEMGAGVALVHHTTKGDQAAKRITDIGAGAGAQSRGVDTHFVVREHEQLDAVVAEAVVRSFPPLQPLVLRWQFPVWTFDAAADPGQLKRSGGRRERAARGPTKPTPPPVEPWTAERFVDAFVAASPTDRKHVLAQAVNGGKLAERRAKTLLDLAIARELAIEQPDPEDGRRSLVSLPPQALADRDGQTSAMAGDDAPSTPRGQR